MGPELVGGEGRESCSRQYKRAFPSSLVPLFESESKYETIELMKMTLICMKMKPHAELIFI